MYAPSYFQESDGDKIFDFLIKNPFAALVTFDGERQTATHLPFIVERDANGEMTLAGHVARANPQWRAFAPNREVLTLFTGAHAYISPRWYDAPLENVPTWNYSAVHVYGTPEIITDAAQVGDFFAALVEKFESGTDYQLPNVNAEYVEKLSRAIVAFRIRATKVETAFKLSQHKIAAPSYQNVILELERQADENSVAVAAAMRENLLRQ